MDTKPMNERLTSLLRLAAEQAGVGQEAVRLEFSLNGGWSCRIILRVRKGGIPHSCMGLEPAETPEGAIGDALQSVEVYRQMFAEDKAAKKRARLAKKS